MNRKNLTGLIALATAITAVGISGTMNLSYFNTTAKNEVLLVNNKESIVKSVNGIITVKADALWINKEPSINMGNLIPVKKGTQLHTTEESANGWFKVTFNGITGWIGGEPYSSFEPIKSNKVTSKAINKYVKVEASDLLMNKNPKPNDGVITVLHHGTIVHAIGESSNGWYKIEYNGKIGWIGGKPYSSIINDQNTKTTYTVKLETTTGKLLETKQYIGKPTEDIPDIFPKIPTGYNLDNIIVNGITGGQINLTFGESDKTIIYVIKKIEAPKTGTLEDACWSDRTVIEKDNKFVIGSLHQQNIDFSNTVSKRMTTNPSNATIPIGYQVGEVLINGVKVPIGSTYVITNLKNIEVINPVTGDVTQKIEGIHGPGQDVEVIYKLIPRGKTETKKNIKHKQIKKYTNKAKSTSNKYIPSKNLPKVKNDVHKSTKVSQNILGKVEVVADELCMNRNPKPNDDIITILKKGTIVNYVGISSNGWYKVIYNNVEGWIGGSPYSTVISKKSNNIKSKIIKKKNENEQVTTINSPIGLWMNYSPSANSRTVTCLNYNTKVTVLGEEDGWYKVSYNGKIGWIDSEYTTGLTTLHNSGNSIDNHSNKSLSVIINSPVGLWMNYGPTANSGTITCLNYNTKVTVLAEYNGWYKINYNGNIGWIDAEYTTAEVNIAPPKQRPIEISVNSPVGLWMNYGPSASSGTITCLSYGTKLQVILEQNGWYKVNYNGQTGWVDGAYCS